MSEIIENELYELDEATNALVPVYVLAGGLQAGDKVRVCGNKLYKVDEPTNGLIPVVVVEKNGSYSLDEVKTAETWIDGKPIYRRCWTGNIVAAANTNGYRQFMDNVDSIISSKGWWQNGQSSNKLSVPHSMGETESGITSAISGVMGFNSVSPVERTGTTNNAYQIWVEYTKTTD